MPISSQTYFKRILFTRNVRAAELVEDRSTSHRDRIFVAADRREFDYSRLYSMRSSDLEAHDRFLSDHYMVKASVKDYLDDADPR